jgi:hypothetical protein
MDVLDPFLLPVDLTPDHSFEDRVKAADEALLRQRLLLQFLRGEIDADTYNDCLNDQGENVEEYWEVVEDNLNTAMQFGRRVGLEGVESLIYVPFS